MSSQGAGNNGGQAAGRQFVSFTRPAAQRIAKVVRTVEAGNRTQPGVEFDHPMPSAVAFKVIRQATFNGPWPLGESTAVTFVQTPTATVNATNLTWPTDHCVSSGTMCIVGKEGTNWWLLARAHSCDCDEPLTKAKLATITGYGASSRQVLGHAPGSGADCVSLEWMNVIDCDPNA